MKPVSDAATIREIAEADARYVLEWLRQSKAPENIVQLQERATAYVTADAARAENRLGKANDDRAQWRERARSAEQALALFGDHEPEIRVVRWLDSSLQNAQVGISDAPVPEVITSVGFVVKETDDYVVLARDDHKDDEWRGLCAIPKCCVEEGDHARA